MKFKKENFQIYTPTRRCINQNNVCKLGGGNSRIMPNRILDDEPVTEKQWLHFDDKE